MNIVLCREDARYEAGSQLLAEWRLRRVALDALQSVEVSILWQTTGKGDEDFSVHHFRRYHLEELTEIGLESSHPVSSLLPVTPLSYRGHLIEIGWLVRTRVFMSDGREIVAEQPFYLVSSLPSPRESTASSTPDEETVRVDDTVRVAPRRWKKLIANYRQRASS
ncbi:MAG: hypothetical protein AAGD07_02850 [Planctomycetota bacterium]